MKKTIIVKDKRIDFDGFQKDNRLTVTISAIDSLNDSSISLNIEQVKKLNIHLESVIKNYRIS